MAASRITFFNTKTGASTEPRIVQNSKIKKVREQMEREGWIITSSKPVRA